MARKHIGKRSWGGVIALCALLLWVPQTRGQNITVKVKKFTITGSVGVPNVTMQGLPGTPAPITTDENGVYTAEVNYGWSGTVKPTKLGYVFQPAEKPYTSVTSNLSDQNYTARLLTYTVSGSTSVPGVRLTGFPTEVTSDASGRYSTLVEFGWTGVITPEKMGYRFEPSTRQYNVRQDSKTDNYKAVELTFTISGNVGTPGVAMTGLPGNVISKEGGKYSGQVGYGWNGKVTPTKEGYRFTPEFREYPIVTAETPNEDYQAEVFTYKISGSTGLPGVVMKGLPNDPVTDANGFYSVDVEHGLSLKVKPEYPGYTFDPQQREYAKVVADQASQDYLPAVIYLTISGKTGAPNVTLEGLPGNPTSDATGLYSVKVEYGWSGTVTPQKEGYYFEPASQTCNSITQDQKQDYKGKAVTFEITGNIQLPGVTLQVQGLPTSPTTGQDGSYKIEVPYKWKGTITPKKAGFEFDPVKREYADVLASMPGEDYLGRIIQYTISGKVTGETGPLADITIVADNNGGSAVTDSSGEFQLQVGHGWRGKLTPQNEGYTFTPANKPLEAVSQNLARQDFTAKVRMLTIANILKVGNEPLADVTVTAEPGNYTTKTGRDGKYTLRVPYGYTGQLKFEKEGFDFSFDDPSMFSFTDLRNDIDATAPKRPTPPPADTTRPLTGTTATPPAGTTTTPLPGTTATPPTGTTTTPPTGPQLTPAQAQQRLAQVQQELTTALAQAYDSQTKNQPVPAQLRQRITALQTEQATLQQQLQALPPAALTPDVTGQQGLPTMLPGMTPGSFGTSMGLTDVLTLIMQRTNAKIMIDATVKNTPVSVAPEVLSANSGGAALAALMQGQTQYQWRPVGENAYIVYKPISQMFTGDDLRQALSDLSTTAGVPIIPDANVSGKVYADIRDQPLEKALEIMVAGTPYVVKRTPDFYLVADRGVRGPAFPEISETRIVSLSYVTPERVRAMISPAFAPYVQAMTADPRDPNNRGSLVTVTAPTSLADRIVADIRRMDVRPRQVLLDARVVTLERGDLLNLGVDWRFPTLQAGFGYDNTLSNNTDIGKNLMTGIRLGYTADRAFTNSLLAALNLLQENSQAEIVSSPQILAQDGRQSQLKVVTEEWFQMVPPSAQQAFFFSQSELQKVESGTILSITPRIGDHNDMTLEMAIEVSDSIPSGRGSNLPVVTRRQAKNAVTVEDGGTVALAGLTESRSRTKDTRVPGLSKLPLVGPLFKNQNKDKANREVAVFVTAHLIQDVKDIALRTPQANQATVRVPAAAARADGFETALRQEMANRNNP